MGGDAFLFLFFWFSQTKQKTATGKDFDPAIYPNRFKSFPF